MPVSKPSSVTRYPKWMVELWIRGREEDARKRREAYAIKRQAERQAGER